jgi:hypothetical protein
MNDMAKMFLLLHKKTELNKRRRRMWNNNYIDGYHKTRAEMKSMTPQLRQLRQRTNSRFIWDDSGHVSEVELTCGDGSTFRVKRDDYLHWYEKYIVDDILLRGI